MTVNERLRRRGKRKRKRLNVKRFACSILVVFLFVGVARAITYMPEGWEELADRALAPLEIISFDEPDPPPQPLVTPHGIEYTWEDVDLLERLVMAEAGAEPYEGQIAVVNVVLNRVLSPKYPNTIREVVYQYGQFTPAMSGKIDRVRPSASVKQAVKEALAGKEVVPPTTLFFLNPKLAVDKIVIRTKDVVATIGNHTFYKDRK